MSPNLEGFGLTSLCFPDIYFSQRKTFYQNPYIHQSFTQADLLTGSLQDSYSGTFLQNPLWLLFLTDCDVGSDFDFQGLWLAESWLVNFRFNGTWMEVTCWSRFHCFWLCSSMGKCCSVWFEVLVRTGTFIPATPVSLQTASTCCFGWPTSWWSTVLGISSDLHISMSARIIMADWLFCGDPCTTLGRSTGKWVGPSRHHNHFPPKPSLHAILVQVPLTLVGQSNLDHTYCLIAHMTLHCGGYVPHFPVSRCCSPNQFCILHA